MKRLGLVLAGSLLASCGGDNATTPDAASPRDAGSDIAAAVDVASLDASATDVATEATVDVPPPVDLGSGPIDPLAWPVDHAGPYRVGYRQIMHTYTPRGSTTPRSLPLHVWYPTLVAEGRNPTYALIFNDHDSYIDAPPAPPAFPRGYPVHVYSHGDRGFGPTSAFLMRYFASHGWLCVAPDHTGNTLLDNLSPRPAEIYYWRGLDVTEALDAVGHFPSADPLAGRADTHAAILSGHSFGTHTVWASAGATYDLDAIRPNCTAANLCSQADLDQFQMGVHDPRFVAVLPLAGSIQRDWFGPDGHRSVHVPMFAMSGTDDNVGDDVQFATTAGVDLTWIEVRGGCHQFFALGHCANIDDSLQAPIVGTYAFAFARRHLLGDASSYVGSILDGTHAVNERVTYHHHGVTP